MKTKTYLATVILVTFLIVSEMMQTNIISISSANPTDDSIVVTNLFNGQIVTEPTQTVEGYVLDPTTSKLDYNVSSLLHEDIGTAKVLDGNFSFDINLTEGDNLLTISDGINEETLNLMLDTSAPLVTFTAGPYFNKMAATNLFSETLLFPSFFWPDFGYAKKKVEKLFDENGRVTIQDIVYLDGHGNKVGDEHITFERTNTGEVQKKTTNYTDSTGQVIRTVIEERGTTTEIEYDSYGRKIKERVPFRAGWEEIEYQYDEKGRVTKMTTIFRDKNGKVEDTYVYEYDPSTHQSTRSHYKGYFGKLIRREVTTHVYDPQTKSWKTTTTIYEGIFFKGSTETTYIYDEKGRLIKKIVVETHEDGTRDETTTEYDSRGKKTKETTTTTKPGYGSKPKITEKRFVTNLPNFAEPTPYTCKILISDISSNPSIPCFGVFTVLIYIVNSTGSYNDSFWTVGNSFDYNLTLSMDTIITIMVIDEAGNVGINTIQIQIPSSLATDINNDHSVNIMDISIVAIAYGSYPGHPRWNLFADVSNDDIVDIRDIAMVARDLGKKY